MVAAVVGIVAARRLARRPAARILRYGLIGCLGIAIVVLLFDQIRYLFNPGVCLFTMVVAGELGAAAYRFLRVIPPRN
jgi:hypothetical protein